MENKDVYENKDICMELQECRYELSQLSLKKTGENAYAKFKYFQLGDFLPDTIRILNKHGLFSQFYIEENDSGKEYAHMDIRRGMELIPFKIPAERPTPNKTPNPIQEEGSMLTYLRRYLYQIVMDIVEDDEIDATSGAEEKISAGNKADLISLGGYLTEEFKNIKVKSTGDLDNLTNKQAVELIAIAKDKKAKGFIPTQPPAPKKKKEPEAAANGQG